MVDTTVHCHFRNGSDTNGPQCMRGWLQPEFIYGVYVLLDAHGVAYKVRLDGSDLETVRLDALVSNRLQSPLLIPTDGHYCFAVGVDDEDTVFITGNHHDGNGVLADPTSTHMIQCDNVDAFTTPGSWSASSTSAWDTLATGGGYNSIYTYHHFDRDNNGVLVHFLSQSEGSGNSQGRDYIAFKRTGGTWSPLRGDGHFATTVNGPSNEADRVYVEGILFESNGGGAGIDRLHVQGIWRTNDTDPTSQQAPWYLYADGPDYDVWNYKGDPSDGIQTMPLTWFNRANAEVDVAPATSHSIYRGVCLDDNGYPSFIVEDEGTNNYVRLQWEGPGTGWTSTAMSAFPGELYEFRLNRKRYLRKVTTGYQHIRDVVAGTDKVLGHSIPTSGDVLSPNPEPTLLRGKHTDSTIGMFWTCIPKGDTPTFPTFGQSRHASVAN